VCLPKKHETIENLGEHCTCFSNIWHYYCIYRSIYLATFLHI